jgi:hypothetical protein
VTENPVRDTLHSIAAWLEEYAKTYGPMPAKALKSAARELRDKAEKA